MVVEPESVAEASDALRAANAGRRTVRFVGGGTKLGWGAPGKPIDAELSTRGLRGVVEHNAPDLTAIVQAGSPLQQVQAAFADRGQMLPLDPPLGADDKATVGGVIASGDSGPLRHRHGAPRDLLLGMTVVLADGTVARSGGKVIKNVAGYDLSKLFAGSFGTLGLIARVAVRLRPLPVRSVTVVGETSDPALLQGAARALGGAPLELEALDLFWVQGAGEVLAQLTGVAVERRAGTAATLAQREGLGTRIVESDDTLWRRQREGQRAHVGACLRVSGLPTRIADVVRAADDAGGSVVGRAGIGLFWIRLPPAETEALVRSIHRVRDRLRPLPCVLLDAPAEVRSEVDVWHTADGVALGLMRRVKTRFDPTNVCAPGTFVGGI
jgi:glycolate oxidase FAD binding subunit